MKRIAPLFAHIPLLLLSCIFTHAQSPFAVNDGALSWRRVFNGDITAEGAALAMRKDKRFVDIEAAGDMVTATLTLEHLDYEGAGYKRSSLPLYIVNNGLEAFVVLEVKEGRFRVTASRMLTLSRRSGPYPLDEQAVRKGEIAEPFRGAPAQVIDYNLRKAFNNLPKNERDDNW